MARICDKERLKELELAISKIENNFITGNYAGEEVRHNAIDTLRKCGFENEAVFFEAVATSIPERNDEIARDVINQGLYRGIQWLHIAKYKVQDRIDNATRRKQRCINWTSIILALLSLIIGIVSLFN